jgi:hypothetical protein
VASIAIILAPLANLAATFVLRLLAHIRITLPRTLAGDVVCAAAETLILFRYFRRNTVLFQVILGATVDAWKDLFSGVVTVAISAAVIPVAFDVLVVSTIPVLTAIVGCVVCFPTDVAGPATTAISTMITTALVISVLLVCTAISSVLLAATMSPAASISTIAHCAECDIPVC